MEIKKHYINIIKSSLFLERHLFYGPLDQIFAELYYLARLSPIQQFRFFFLDDWFYLIHDYMVKVLCIYIKGKNNYKAQMISRISYGYGYPQQFFIA